MLKNDGVSELAELQMENAEKHRGNFPHDPAFILIPRYLFGTY